MELFNVNINLIFFLLLYKYNKNNNYKSWIRFHIIGYNSINRFSYIAQQHSRTNTIWISLINKMPSLLTKYYLLELNLETNSNVPVVYIAIVFHSCCCWYILFSVHGSLFDWFLLGFEWNHYYYSNSMNVNIWRICVFLASNWRGRNRWCKYANMAQISRYTVLSSPAVF